MNKTLLTLALIFAAPTALATAPTAGYLQVQDDTTGTDTTDDFGGTPGEGDEGVAEDFGENVDQAAEETGEAIDTAATETGEAVDTAVEDVNDAVDPNNDGVVDANNDGVADTRQFPWGLLGLAGLFGLLGRNRPGPVPVATHTTTTSTTDRR
ncbi:hypothetical protein F8S09_12670 [Deinococcus sp. SDU3-2]|uniref:MYXO-CTERM domain-containing protein n=1 Tax=Deinococcus terrestris TaxID=2651870 RepID=A0A7X1TSL5_9DEIO|nr:hypothetical protein [Deinococcus terrestris]MPY67527.1 hypothetical protein [Deinococcus terrestris]